MLDFITSHFFLVYILPVIATMLFILLALAIKKIRDNLFLNFPNVKIREVRWGLSQTLMGITFFVFGVAFTVLTIALSTGGAVMMGLGVALFVVAIAMIIYVFWLSFHYLGDSLSKNNKNIEQLNREIRDNLKKK
ncbi:MAG: hypothetical protein KAV87_29075 [Desulfobacteraceae bacterium]|nr:hypothetical protein [Desulfobacteraceae bacterium]